MSQVKQRREYKIQKAYDNHDWNTISKLLNQPFENSKRKDRANNLLYLNHIKESQTGHIHEFGDNITNNIITPMESLLIKEIQNEINDALSLLNKTNYSIIIGFYLDNKSYAQLSRELGISDKTIKKRLTKSTNVLKKHINKPF